MEQALHFSLGQKRLHAVCGSAIKELNATEKNGQKRSYELAVANRLFGQKGYEFLQPFLTQTENYGAKLEPLDFKTDAEGSRQFINKWVEGKTKERIKDLIPLKGVNEDTKLVLTNAIYFKGNWATQFKKEETLPADFRMTPEQNANVPMMHINGDFKYTEEPGKLQVLELPYKDNELSMLIFLPAKVDGLAELEKSFDTVALKKWSDALAVQMVNVTLPKFKMTWGTKNLKDTLKSLGIKTAFTIGSANFSGMDGGFTLFISAVFHKAFVEVNEEGTEAAAATAVAVYRGSSRPPEAKNFRADHPFLFVIRENATGGILFIGRVTDPR